MALPSGLVTFLFTDVEGSTRLYQQHPDAMPSALARHDDLLRHAIEAHGGVLFRTTGDGVCAVFPDAAGAVAAALDAQQELARATWAVTGPLRVRMGVHTGAAEATDDGYTYSLALVLAQRLMSAGHGGQTLVSAAAAEAVRDRLPSGVALRSLGEQRLRSLAAREPVYQLVISDVPTEFPPLRLPEGDESQDAVALLLDRLERGRLVGRGGELEQLRRHWERCMQARGHLVLLSGEPGVGKTRLALALLEQARADGATVLRGGCYEYEAATPYLPFVEALREWVHRQSAESLNLALGDTAAEIARLAPEIEAHIGPLPASAPLGPAEERLRLFDSVARLLDRIGEQSGLILFVDDLHWADPGTLALLHYLLRALRESPVLLLGAYREVELDRTHRLAASLVEWNRARLATRISLDRLSLADTAALLSSLFGEQAISSEFAALIYGETEGNPFFVEEVVKTLIEQGQIYREGDEWGRKELPELTVPQSVKEAIGRRLDRLAPQTTETLSIAAALGKQFAYIELAAVAGTDEDALLDALDEATAAQLLRPAGGDALAFTHDKIREVLYQEANPLRRRRLHRRIGEALETLHRGRAEAHMADLAYHFAEAGDLERTLEYSLWASEGAAQLFAHDDALAHLARALEAAQQLDNLEATADIHQRMGHSAYAAGRHVEAADYYRQAMVETSDPRARAALKVRVGDAHTMTGSHEGLAVLTEALRELDPETQPADLALALALIGRLHHFRAEHTQAIAALERARVLAEPLDDPPALVWIYSALSGAYQHLCQFERSDAWGQACIALGERRAFLPAVCIGHEMLAENAALRGDWSAAKQRAIIDRETAQHIGDQDRVAWSGYPLAYALHGQGQVEAARAESAASLQLADRIGDRRLSCWLEAWLAVTHADLGRHDAAASHAARAQQRAAELEQTTLQAIARYGTIIAALRRGDIATAAAEALIHMASARATEARLPLLIGGELAAEAFLESGDVVRAAELIEEHIAFSAGRAAHPHTVARRVRGRVRAAQGDLAGARADLDAAVAALDALGSRLELARALKARTRLRGDGWESDAARASMLFEECGVAER